MSNNKQINNNISLLKKIKQKKKKHPVFKQPNYGRTKRKRVKDAWRKPRGIDNAQRKKLKKAGNLPEIGYRNPRMIRHLHPTGRREILVSNKEDIDNIKYTDVSEIIIKIRKGVGKLKAQQIVDYATQKGFAIANRNKTKTD